MPNLPFRPPPTLCPPSLHWAAASARPRESLLQRLARRLRRTPPYGISAVVHLAALLIFATVVVERPRDLAESFAGVFQVGLWSPKPDAAETPREAEEPAPEPAPEPEPPQPEPKAPVLDPTPTPPGPEAPAPPKDQATASVKAAPVLDVAGAGPPARDPFAGRQPSGRPEALRQFGGSPGSERAVDAGLDWLCRHQDRETGCWTDGDPQLKLSPGLTGFALLAFLGKGHTHTEPGPYRDALARGIAYLLRLQTPDGRFGEPYLLNGERNNRFLMYHQAIAALALAEAHGMTRDPALRDPVRRAVAFIERAQQVGGGWDYGDLRTGRNDMSVTGWQIMALKSAHAADIEVSWQTLFGVLRHLEGSTNSAGEVSYADRGPFAFRRGPGMVAVGMFCRQILGWPRDSDLLARQADLLLAQLPNWERMWAVSDTSYLHTTYYWYYGTLAMFNLGGRWWDRWNTHLRDLLIAHQHHEGDRRGSWDPPKEGFDATGGRVYTTALNILNLEIYYRYLPLYRGGSFDAVDILDRAAKVRGADGMRRAALGLLAPFRTARAQDILVAALDDPDPGARAAARRTLVEQHCERVVPALLAELGASSPLARTQALGDLAALGEKRFLPHFIQGLRDPEKVVRLKAATALTRLTGQNFAYHPDGPPAEREAAIAQWESWLKGEKTVPPPEAIRGTVLVVDPRTPDSVVLDVGREQAVRPGQRFEVLREGQVIAVVEATKVEPSLTVARIIERRGGEIREGDQVRPVPGPAISTRDD